MKKTWLMLLLGTMVFRLFAQQDGSKTVPVKVQHAEPLFIDLIRDLGARKGEREWNAGWGMENQGQYSSQTGFVEYEFSPINRVGLEVEVPVHLYHVIDGRHDSSSIHRDRVEGIKLATQYTFYVSASQQLSVAAGYIHEFRLHSFYTIHENSSLLKGHGFNPFLIIAKRFGRHVHTLLYTGPAWEKNYHDPQAHVTYQVNASVHYMLTDKHFIGVEVNEEFAAHHVDIVARPQLKIVLNSSLAVGFVTGIPISSNEKGMSFLARIIYEPGSRK